MSDCPIALIPEDSRLTTFPLARPEIFAWYESAVQTFWSHNQVVLTKDAIDYRDNLTPPMRHFVNYILAFFAAADGLVNANLCDRFKREIPILEVGYFYDFQMAIENIHAHTYSILLDSIITDAAARLELINGIQTIPIIAKLTQYIQATAVSTAPLAERLLRMACVEGIFFSGCFCAIFWLKKRGLMPGLVFSNEEISRDEGLHAQFAMFLLSKVDPKYRLGRAVIKNIVSDAVENYAVPFVEAALPVDLPGMNSRLMIPYVKNQADCLIGLINEAPIYGCGYELDFMVQLNLTTKTEFFIVRNSQYSSACAPDDGTFNTCAEF